MAKKRLKRRDLNAEHKGGAGEFFARLVEQIKTPVGLGVSVGVLIVIGAIIAWLVIQARQAPPPGGYKALTNVPAAERNGYYKDMGAPSLAVDPTKAYTATITVARNGQTLGAMVFRLYADRAPMTVNNFVFLARQGFYDGLTFHRVIDGFMAQGGDPSGTGTGGPGYTFPDEPSALVQKFTEPGLLAMANSGADTNGSQFFITLAPTLWLNGKHAIFGKIVGGQTVLTSIQLRDPDTATTPGDVIQTIEITEGPAAPYPTDAAPVPVPTAAPAATKAPAGSVPVEQRNGYYSAPPPLTIDPAKTYTATIRMAKGGAMVFRLYADKAPQTVNSFVFLAREGYYDGVTFHRVIKDFMAQAGDPSGSGSGGPGYSFADEAGALALTFDRAGLLAMANAGANTNGSQFFITFGPADWLNGKHAIFGEIVSGQEVLQGITVRDPAAATTPGDAIQSITIEEK